MAEDSKVVSGEQDQLLGLEGGGEFTGTVSALLLCD